MRKEGAEYGDFASDSPHQPGLLILPPPCVCRLFVEGLRRARGATVAVPMSLSQRAAADVHSPDNVAVLEGLL